MYGIPWASNSREDQGLTTRNPGFTLEASNHPRDREFFPQCRVGREGTIPGLAGRQLESAVHPHSDESSKRYLFRSLGHRSLGHLPVRGRSGRRSACCSGGDPDRARWSVRSRSPCSQDAPRPSRRRRRRPRHRARHHRHLRVALQLQRRLPLGTRGNRPRSRRSTTSMRPQRGSQRTQRRSPARR